MKNETLATIAEAQKAKLDPNMQDAFERIVLAGMKFLYKDDDTHAMAVKDLQSAESIPIGVGEGIATILMLLLQKSRGTMPMEAGIMAGYALVCEGLDFVEQKGMLKVDNAAIDTAMTTYAQEVMELMQIDEEKITQLKEHSQSVQNDPDIRSSFKEKFGQDAAMPAGEGGEPTGAVEPMDAGMSMPGGGLVGPAPTQGVQP